MTDEVSTHNRYHPVMRAIHWATLLLVAAIFTTVWIADPELVGSYAGSIVQLHRSLGLTVAALTLFRLAWRMWSHIPDLPGDMPAVQRLAARAAEALIYVLLLAQPLIGLLYSNAHGTRVNLFFLGHLPAVIGRDRPLSTQLGDVHSFVGYTLLALIGLHAAAALFHHFVRRDNVLGTMLPAATRR